MRRILHANLVCVIALLTVLVPSASVLAKDQPRLMQTGLKFRNVPGDSIIVQKRTSSRKHRTRLYADAAQQYLLFTVTGKEGRIYQLYLFDYDGKLVKQAHIRNRQTTILPKIEKGEYMFEIFSDDERIENGQLLVL